MSRAPRWTTSHMTPFFHERIPTSKLPHVDWDGFNMCIAPVPAIDRYLCVTRIFLTYAMSIADKIVPGIANPHSLTDPVTRKRLPGTEAFRPKDVSGAFMWGKWGAGTEHYVYFVAAYVTGTGLVADPRFTPMVMTEAKAKLHPVPRPGKVPFPKYITTPTIIGTDYRVAQLDDHIITYDAHMSTINDVLLFPKTGTLALRNAAVAMCVPEDPAAYPTEWNPVTDGARYVKYFDKNWSIVGRLPRSVDAEGRLLCLDWFYPDGIWGVLAATESGVCHRIKLVGFGADPLPAEPTDALPGFSFGSTLMDVHGYSKYAVDAVGVGHIKLEYLGVPAPGNEYNAAFTRIKEALEAEHGDRFKLHYKYAYAAFFYRIFYTAKKWHVRISDAWFPMLQGASALYHSLIYFPMSICRDNDRRATCLVSGGYTDFHNLVFEFAVSDVIGACTMDAARFSLAAFKIIPLPLKGT